MPDPTAVCAFLAESHVALAARVAEYAARELAPLPEPVDDAAARTQARDLAARLGRAGWFAPIGDLDLRAACLVREALASASPLADAVRSEEHTSELQSRLHLVCRLLLEKKNQVKK